MPAFLDLHDAESLLPRPVEVVGLISGAAHTDLGDAAAVEQAFFDCSPKRGAVGDPLAEHRVVDVGMRIDVHETDGAVPLRHRSQDRQHDRVIAAHRRRHQPVSEQRVVVVLNSVDGIEQVVRVGGDVAEVVDSQAVERRGASGHVVRTKQNRLAADAAGPNRAPGRFDVPMSNGTPTTAASS